MKNNYIALTIGPIYKTFYKARRVKEFWAVSYLFSQIMKELTKKIYDSKKVKSDIILPFIDNTDFFKQTRVGLFPDWIIFKTDESEVEYNKLPDFINEVYLSVSELLIVDKIISQNEILTFFNKYLKIYYFKKEVDSKDNPILTLSPHLHQLELQNPINSVDYTPLLYKVFNNLYRTKLYDLHYRKYGDERHLSMEEIATRDIISVIGKENYKKLLIETVFSKEDDDDRNSDYKGKDFFEELTKAVNTHDKKFGKESSFKTYHKYIAIVKADGDKIGKTLKALKQGDEAGFSNSLLQWGKASQKIIEGFDALPIYIGGDDILFFAPVVNNGENILQIIEKINNKFNTQFTDKEVKPSLSFGVSITFYKYPLFEALENADRLLKLAKDKGGNGICFQLLKHSGSSFNIHIRLEQDDKLSKIINQLLVSEEKTSVISSVAYHLRDNEKVFEIIGNDPERIYQFFKNDFEGFNSSDYLKTAKELTVETFKNKISAFLKDTYKETMNEIYNALRFTKFLKGFDENDR